MRLIDADALIEEMNKKALDLANGGMIFIETINNVIDNATTHPNPKDVFWSGVAVGQNREKGKWIPCYVNFTDGSKPLFAYCKCSLCNKQATGDYKFCPNCGAEMRGGES